KVIKGISAKIKARFVITGSHDEQNLANELIGLTGPEVISLSGKLNFKELGALIKRVNLFISNDTGPMHIAAILKTPLVAIFGPGDVTRFDPQNITDKVRVLYEGVNCAPCEKVECNNMKCLGLIKPEQVIEVAIDLLEDSGGKIEKFKYK
ncbi:MAG: glycosyltransferase family 9 protein, partial [Candidatus Omnitrophica bacterium]|nr:glycosyltransferase family 9 protein [Candidatus Omnitrophota bacterium]